MLGLIPQTESTPPLYDCIAWVWARIFGFGEAGPRSLSGAGRDARRAGLHGIGAKLISRRAGLIAARADRLQPDLVW